MTDLLHLVVPHTLARPAAPQWREPLRPRAGRGPAVAGTPGHRAPRARARGRARTTTSPPSWRGLPDRATVLVDGLVGLAAGDVLCRERHRLRLWLLVHLPLALARPRSAGRGAAGADGRDAASSPPATGPAAGCWSTYGLEPARVWTARPGVHPSALSAQTSRGGSLLTVGAVVPDKGHDVLVDALADLADLPWSCRVVGPLDRDPSFVDRLRRQVRRSGLQDRICLTGPLSPAEVSRRLRRPPTCSCCRPGWRCTGWC